MMPWNRLARIEEKLDLLLANQRNETKEIHQMAATQQDIDNALSTVETSLATVQSDTAAVLAKLQSVEPGQPAPDFSAEVDRLTKIQTALSALSTSEEAAVPPTPTTAPAPVTDPSTDPNLTAAAQSAVKHNL